MKERNKFISGMVSGGGAFTIRVLIGLIVIPLIIRGLGVEDFGFYILLLNFSELLITMDAGLTIGMVHRLSHYHARQEPAFITRLLSVGATLYTAIALVIIGIGLLLQPHIPQWFNLSPQHSAIATTAIGLVLADAVINLVGCYFQAILKGHCLYKNTNLTESVQALSVSVLMVGLLLGGYGLLALLSARLLCSMGAAFSLFFQATKAEPLLARARFSLDLPAIHDLFGISIYAMIQRIGVLVAHRIDNLVVALFLTMTDVGIYGLLLRLFGYVSGFATKLLEGVFPIFTRMARMNGPAQSRFFFLRTSALIHFLASMMIIVAMGNYPEIIQFLGSGQISVRAGLLPAILIAVATWSGALQLPASSYLFASGWHRFMTVSSLLTAFVNLGLSLWLVQTLGMVGVGLGTLIPHTIQHQLITIGWACRHMQIPASQYLRAVHARALIPLGGSICLYGLMRLLMDPLTTHWGLLISINLLVGLFSMMTWYRYTATRYEKTLIKGQIAQWRNRGEIKPQYASAPPLKEDFPVSN